MVPVESLRQAGFAVRAAPLVWATGARVRRLDRRLGLGAVIQELRAARERPLPPRLANPLWLAATLERMLPFVPPRHYGPCLRRALILLELWSRCGLEPTLHIGFRPQAPRRDGHAWLTATRPDGESLQASGPLDHAPVFEF